jgi:hypothetical protein
MYDQKYKEPVPTVPSSSQNNQNDVCSDMYRLYTSYAHPTNMTSEPMDKNKLWTTTTRGELRIGAGKPLLFFFLAAIS